MRLIDADAVLAALAIFHRHDNDNDSARHFMNGIETAIELIEDAPDVKAVPIKPLAEQSPLSEFLKLLELPENDKPRYDLFHWDDYEGETYYGYVAEDFLRGMNREKVIKTVLTPAEFLEALKEIDKTTKNPGQQYDDYEQFHYSADNLMCEILRGLGYGDGVDFFETHEKWYA